MLTECPHGMEKQVERAWVHLFEDNGYKLLNVALVKTCISKPGKRGRKPVAVQSTSNGSDQDGAQ